MCWSPPFPPNVKLNFDVAIGDEGTSLAVVCRDHKAKVLFVWTDLIDSTDHLLAEASAAHLAVRKIHEAGFSSVILEGDSLLVIQAIQSIPNAQLWAIDNVIFYIKSILTNFSFWLASHVYRELNTAAHSVARWALNCKCSGTFPISSIPAFVLEEWIEGVDS